jgi:hypothetical protein
LDKPRLEVVEVAAVAAARASHVKAADWLAAEHAAVGVLLTVFVVVFGDRSFIRINSS